MSGILYIVGTPIGNMEDITLRALRILKEVDAIACEDTRHSAILLNKYEIKKPLISYYMHKEKESGERIITQLLGGKNIALITDAGMPCISDPGAILVSMARENGIVVTACPGVSAVVTAMALSGITKRGFCFLGFLPEKTKEKLALVEPYKRVDVQLVFYSSPHDINQDLEFLFQALGERKVYAIKELTKMFENVQEGLLSTLRIDNPRGEYVLIVEGVAVLCELNCLTIEEHLSSYLSSGMDKKDAIKATAKDRNIPKDEVYKVAIKL